MCKFWAIFTEVYLRHLFRQFVPPVLMKALRKPIESPIFDSYEKALFESKTNGYEYKDLIQTVVQKSESAKLQLSQQSEFDLSTLRTLIGVGLTKPDEVLTVLDFGGGCGYHYDLVKKSFDQSLKLNWNVIETPAMAAAAQCFKNDELSFFDSIESALSQVKKIDLVLASSSLQYCPNPLQMLRQLIEATPKYIFITRTPVSMVGKSFVSLQTSLLSNNGPGALPLGVTDQLLRYPITFICKEDIEALLSEKYDLRLVIREGDGNFVAGTTSMPMFGYFCSLRE